MNNGITLRYGKQLVLAAALALFAASTSAQEVVYFDDFSGAGSALDGTTPDTSLTGASWMSGANITDDGNVAGNFTAMLPFQAEANYIYTLSADLLAGDGGNNWLALGFTQDQQADLSQRFINGSNPVLWALSRSANATGDDQSFIGPNTGGGAAASTISADQIEMTLDTTGLEWVWSVDFGADGVDRTETLGSVPNINYVALSNNNLTGSSVDNFQLTRLAVPLNEWAVNGSGSFNDAGNWTEGVVPGAGGTAVLGAAHTTTGTTAVVTLDSPATLGEVRFASDNSYLLDGPAALTLTGSAVIAPIQGTHEVAAPIAGTAGLTKAGPGTLILSNASNSYSGDTVISTGTLRVTDLGAINQASGVVDVAGGATLEFSGDGQGNGASGNLTEQITGAGTVQLQATDPDDPESVGLTTEVITATSANPNFTGVVSIGGGRLAVTNAGALGTADGTAATGTAVGGGFQEGTLQLSGVTVTGERLQIAGRQPEISSPHLSSTGTSEWTGPVVGAGGGNQYNIESQSGTLTLSGSVMLPDSSERFLNIGGAGNGVITGPITDRTIAEGDGAENASTSLIKTGSGTWTIATTPPAEDPGVSTARDAYHQGRTVIEEGTLAVQATGGNAGELFSRTIEVRSGATFDISSFTSYSLQVLEDPDMTLSTGDEVGQELSGGGTINVGGVLQAFDDTTLAPGDGRGTLTVNGNFSYSTFADTPAGTWNYELGDTTAAGDSDRLRVMGTATVNAGAASNIIPVNISPAEGTLASGSYTLIQADTLSVTGSAGSSTYTEAVFDAVGNDITGSMRQTVSVAHAGNSVVLNVTGNSANLNWSGTAGNVWDVQGASNWTGDDTQFRPLDRVTFGNVANKNITVNSSVAPGSVTFDGGAGSTYTVTGSGGMTGFGPVNVDSGTVKLNNTGNQYAGATTVASGARLEINTASTGSMVVDGTLSIGGQGVATGGARTFYADSFSGSGEPLNGTTPDTSFSGATWVAPPQIFEDDGDMVQSAGTPGGSATLAFTPASGSTYVLETSLANITGDSDWLALGFANGQSDTASLSSRFITGAVQGLAWAMYRGDASANDNQTFLGDLSVPGNSGLANPATWLTGANQGGGDVDIRITLDTTGGPGAWTATMEADLGSGYETIRGTETLLDESITSVGIANANATDISGTINSFSLTGTEPTEARLDGQSVRVDGDLVMGADALLEFDFALIGQDFIEVTGAATLDGTIDVTKLGDFTPAGNAEYTLLTAEGGITDLGVNFNLPENFSASIVDMTDLVISFGIEGDFNADGVVNLADYTVWRDNLGAADEAVLSNNGDGAGGVDVGDYALWKQNFGSGAAAGLDTVQATIPEPSTVAMAILGMVALAAVRTRKS